MNQLSSSQLGMKGDNPDKSTYFFKAKDKA